MADQEDRRAYYAIKVQEVPPERAAEFFPIEQEPIIPTMDVPLIIESACPGWQNAGERFPAVPISIEDQAQEQIDSIRAGAACIHVHPRDPKTGVAKISPPLLKQVLDPIFETVGNVVTLNHTWKPADPEIDYITETARLLEMGGGNKYCQGSVVLPINHYALQLSHFSVRTSAIGVEWMWQNKVKPVFQLYDSFSHLGFKQHIIDHGHYPDPKPVFNLHLGKHHSHAVHRDPWSRLSLIANFNTVNETIPGAVVGVYPGGRNWLPILVEGLMLGAPLVRVGVEDCYWVYPHRNEVIKKNSDMIKLVVDIATAMGRRVVTDFDEARRLLGIELTS